MAVPNLPETSGAFRQMALKILQQAPTVKDSICCKRPRAGWDETVLDAISAGFYRLERAIALPATALPEPSPCETSG